jgi:hypothetical protein
MERAVGQSEGKEQSNGEKNNIYLLGMSTWQEQLRSTKAKHIPCERAFHTYDTDEMSALSDKVQRGLWACCNYVSCYVRAHREYNFGSSF